MGRAKILMEQIRCNKRRRSTYSKRILGLKKKTSELSTLCGIDTCIISFGPNREEPETWPENRSEVIRIIEKYKSNEDREKRKEDLSSILESKMKSAKKQLDQIRKKNSVLNFPCWDDRLNGLSYESLRELVGNLDMKLELMKKRVENLNSKEEKSKEELLIYNDTPLLDLPPLPSSIYYTQFGDLGLENPTQILQVPPISYLDLMEFDVGSASPWNLDVGFPNPCNLDVGFPNPYLDPMEFNFGSVNPCNFHVGFPRLEQWDPNFLFADSKPIIEPNSGLGMAVNSVLLGEKDETDV
ncbi:agamous-like MADS-box protein AGL61 [Tasmannia lanceolata]|uniref:agamous-like MADS-box protein AGL61 n=1 Tax=Tasmannia lanceolata TaxID=3420 RepID=UPI004063C65A